jgi:hypothetical protein
VIEVVAAQLKVAKAANDTPADLDPDLEAVSLLAMSAGLGQSVLAATPRPGKLKPLSTTTFAACSPHLGQVAYSAHEGPARGHATTRISAQFRFC